jgi:putative addiction module component (TIGR02574 family)
MLKTEELMSEAESLPLNLKTQLIDRLLNSINPSQNDIDKLWAEEAEKRVAEIQTGEVKPISGDIVFREIQERFSK